MRSFLSQRSLLYQDDIVTWSSAEDQERASLDNHVQEIRICDTDLNSGIELGTRLMIWQVMLPLKLTTDLAVLKRHYDRDTCKTKDILLLASA